MNTYGKFRSRLSVRVAISLIEDVPSRHQVPKQSWETHHQGPLASGHRPVSSVSTLVTGHVWFACQQIRYTMSRKLCGNNTNYAAVITVNSNDGLRRVQVDLQVQHGVSSLHVSPTRAGSCSSLQETPHYWILIVCEAEDTNATTHFFPAIGNVPVASV
jgi:hypothetical protein